MKKQWITVEGRMTPIILPQIWNHELQDWVVTSEQNPLPTQLYGSIVEQETALPREIYSDTSNALLDIPSGVRGAFVYIRVHGVTGSFASDEGYKLWAFPILYSIGTAMNGSIHDNYDGMNWMTSRDGSSSSPSVYLYPNLSEARTTGKNLYYPTRIDVGTRLRVDIRVSGTFNEGEGIDAQIYVRWLK